MCGQMRRALAREAMDLLNEALEDAKAAAASDPSSKEAAAAVPRLERLANEKLEKQKEEMMGKLKDLGARGVCTMAPRKRRRHAESDRPLLVGRQWHPRPLRNVTR